MDHRSMLAIVLSVLVITVGFIVQNTFFAPPKDDRPPIISEEPRRETDERADTVERLQPVSEDAVQPYGDAPEYKDIKYSTELFDIHFSNRGGIIKSIQLKEHYVDDEPLEMIWRGHEEQGAFTIHFGGPGAKARNEHYFYQQIDEYSHQFYRDYAVKGADGELIPFTLRKTYTFGPEEYLLELRISIENSIREYPNLIIDRFSYTLGFGPQIGPEVDTMDGRYEYRQYFTYADGSRSRTNIRNQDAVVDKRVTWAAIAGKYFTAIGIPDATQYTITFSERPVPGLEDSSHIYFSRPPIRSSRNQDLFRFYLGPRSASELGRYNDANSNAFGVRDLNLNEALDSRFLLGWLEAILKFILNAFYMVIPNYGIAIILLTIFTKAILWPITHKSHESMGKMQALSPKMTEIREKYKNDPNKMNKELAELYKREKVNPLGGCLPLLLQMPIFIALYGLFNNYFELRGAHFIPGWINDLSSPESIFNFAPLSMPVIGSDIRLLPILFVLTMFFSSKMMQPAQASASGPNMKMITYMMPGILFFVLYNAPSGLLLYWTITNLLTVVQQKYISIRRMKEA